MASSQPQKKKPAEIIERVQKTIGASNFVIYYPLVVESASGATVKDIEGKEYLDFIGSWTAAGVGYSDPEVVSAVESELKKTRTERSNCMRRHATARTLMAATT